MVSADEEGQVADAIPEGIRHFALGLRLMAAMRGTEAAPLREASGSDHRLERVAVAPPATGHLDLHPGVLPAHLHQLSSHLHCILHRDFDRRSARIGHGLVAYLSRLHFSDSGNAAADPDPGLGAARDPDVQRLRDPGHLSRHAGLGVRHHAQHHARSAVDRRAYFRAAGCLGSSRWDVFRHVVVPGALPFIFTGLQISVGVAWFSLVAAEMVSGDFGLGYLILSSYMNSVTAPMVIAMLTLVFVGWFT